MCHDRLIGGNRSLSAMCHDRFVGGNQGSSAMCHDLLSLHI